MIRRNEVRLGVAAVGLLLSVSMASAAAPVTMDGWRYTAGPNGLHVFVCARVDCVPGSRLVCQSKPPHSALLPGILRKWDEMAAELSGEPPEVRTTSHRLSGIVDSATSQYVLISSSNDEYASRANLARFEKALQEASK
ncbi:hypothetical protein ACQR10_10945 [Bradyrhizobium sp. HKCCYLRH2060]|uniref:hypothetical protein n=1 Tax=Bradyrhizobium TaxID=374 RepID=UPI0028E5A433|nr:MULTISPECIES: hypothetical protein [unclassified Bradyrhizobium]